MPRPLRMTTFDLIVVCLAVAYGLQFPILTLINIPTGNAEALTDGLKDLRSLIGLIVGAYVRDKMGPVLDQSKEPKQ